MKKVYRFYLDCGRMGDLSGVFVADDADVAKLMGRYVIFGEVLGKHSDIAATMKEDLFTVATDDQDFIAKLEDILGSGTIAGYSPFDYLDEEE